MNQATTILTRAGAGQVGFPRANAVSVGLDLGQAFRRQQVGEGALVFCDGEVVGLVERRDQRHRAFRIDAVAIDQLH